LRTEVMETRFMREREPGIVRDGARKGT